MENQTKVPEETQKDFPIKHSANKKFLIIITVIALETVWKVNFELR